MAQVSSHKEVFCYVQVFVNYGSGLDFGLSCRDSMGATTRLRSRACAWRSGLVLPLVWSRPGFWLRYGAGHDVSRPGTGAWRSWSADGSESGAWLWHGPGDDAGPARAWPGHDAGLARQRQRTRHEGAWLGPRSEYALCRTATKWTGTDGALG